MALTIMASPKEFANNIGISVQAYSFIKGRPQMHSPPANGAVFELKNCYMVVY